MAEPTIEDCIEETFGGILVPNKNFDRLSAELARLRAEAEAWRAVRAKWDEDIPWERTVSEISEILKRQITRLDQLKATPTGGE